MMRVRSMPVLQCCVEVRGQLSKSVLPYSPHKLGALGWRPGIFGSDLLFLPPGITDAHCCLWLFSTSVPVIELELKAFMASAFTFRFVSQTSGSFPM